MVIMNANLVLILQKDLETFQNVFAEKVYLLWDITEITNTLRKVFIISGYYLIKRSPNVHHNYVEELTSISVAIYI